MNATIKTGLPKADRAEVANALSKALADSFQVYLKVHGYHWNVRGENFFSAHNLLEQQYTEIWAALDDLAERIRALGEYAPQSHAAFANLTSIKDGDASQDWEAMFRELMRDHETVIATLRDTIKVASDAEDESTADLCTQRLAAHEKHAWMLRSTLGGK
ncbi:MAG: Dps family protein [Brevundimonas sp.]|jgi:starvation-inducible DNA-binding protein|uniref:Dps family protein n=1 Tax=Brevundimonas sp. TaxID=1871086 RepID=UPI00391BCCC1